MTQREWDIISPDMKRLLFAAAALLACALPAASQTMSYGPNITLETAKTLAAPAIAEARKNNWNMAIAIVDTAGDLVYFERMDDTQIGSVQVAQAKARSAARFKRPTTAFQDALAAGGEGLRILALDGNTRGAPQWWEGSPSRAASRSCPAARSSARSGLPAAPASRTASSPRRRSTR